MKRDFSNFLDQWKQVKPGLKRKPLIIRGARQVGKTTLIENWGRENFKKVHTVNFEKSAELRELFRETDLSQVILLLEIHFKEKLDVGNDLLFLDEIQACPEALPLLRSFYENLPALAVIATGSLLDFTLKKHDFSMPVGRVEFAYLGPMNYREFLLAVGEEKLVEYLDHWKLDQSFPHLVHEKCLDLLKKYALIGGMPEAILTWQHTHSLLEVQKIQQSLLSTFEADFSKYASHAKIGRVQQLFMRLPQRVGQKTVFSKLCPDERSRDLSAAYELLKLARVITQVLHSSCNGIPLGAEVDQKFFKTLFLDIGLVSRALKLDLSHFNDVAEVTLVHQGVVSEQFVGQELLSSLPEFEPPELHYWAREEKSSSAEVDYVIQQGSWVVPVEVKSGKTGRLRSLHLFLSEKKRQFGLRFNSEPPSYLKNNEFELLSLPLYMAGWARKISAAKLVPPT